MSLSSGDLLSSLSILLLAAVIVGLAVAFGVARARKKGNHTVALSIARTIGLWWALISALGVVFAVVNLSSDGVRLSGSVLDWVSSQEGALPSKVTDCTLEPDSTAPILICSGYVENVNLGPRVLLMISTLLLLATSAAIGWAIFTAAYRAELGTPFHSLVARTFLTTGVVVAITAIVGELLHQIGMTLTAQSLPWLNDEQVPYFLSVPLWPIAVLIGCFALSAIFQYGARLQRETEGLV